MSDQVEQKGRATEDDITSAPRLQAAEWNFERIWRKSRYAVITIINLSIFSLIWEWFGTWYDNEAFFPKFSSMVNALMIGWFGGGTDTTNATYDLGSPSRCTWSGSSSPWWSVSPSA
jgi:hypothetical protein